MKLIRHKNIFGHIEGDIVMFLLQMKTIVFYKVDEGHAPCQCFWDDPVLSNMWNINPQGFQWMSRTLSSAYRIHLQGLVPAEGIDHLYHVTDFLPQLGLPMDVLFRIPFVRLCLRFQFILLV